MKAFLRILSCFAVSVSVLACGEIRPVATLSESSAIGASAGELAQKLEAIMEGTLYYSEADYPWTAFHSRVAVSKLYGENELRLALRVPAGAPIRVYSANDTREIWQSLREDNSSDPQAATRYGKLHSVMHENLQDVRFIKIGKGDSGALDFFVVGRDARGFLIGVKTIKVET
ncbi:MAG: hypothetical protein RIQ81_2468 [Pseudomonadota bacterium]